MFCFLKLNQKFIIVNFVTNFWELTLMNDNYDILIIGSGPSGVSTWLHLNKYAPELSLRTVILDKGKLNNVVNKIFEKLNIKIPKIDIDNVIVKQDKKQFIFKKRSFMSIIHRSLFDEYLVNIVRKRGGKIFENEEFFNMHRDKDNLIIFCFEISLLY